MRHFSVMYTLHLVRKSKIWHDGTLKLYDSRKAVLYSSPEDGERPSVVDEGFLRPMEAAREFGSGDSIKLGQSIIEIDSVLAVEPEVKEQKPIQRNVSVRQSRLPSRRNMASLNRSGGGGDGERERKEDERMETDSSSSSLSFASVHQSIATSSNPSSSSSSSSSLGSSGLPHHHLSLSGGTRRRRGLGSRKRKISYSNENSNTTTTPSVSMLLKKNKQGDEQEREGLPSSSSSPSPSPTSLSHSHTRPSSTPTSSSSASSSSSSSSSSLLRRPSRSISPSLSLRFTESENRHIDLSIPNTFSNVNMYKSTFNKALYLDMTAQLEPLRSFFFKKSISLPATLHNQPSQIRKWWRSSRVPFYSNVEIQTRTPNSWRGSNKYTSSSSSTVSHAYLCVPPDTKEHYSQYTKDDLWIVSSEPFFRSDISLYRSVWYGFSSSGSVEIVPFDSPVSKVKAVCI